jgi:hypothetical protein
VNGVSLYYEEHGAGAPILGIHGAGSSGALWGGAAPELGKRGRTILYDRRGSFRSERPEPLATDVPKQADDAAALIDALGAAPAIVIGRSLSMTAPSAPTRVNVPRNGCHTAGDVVERRRLERDPRHGSLPRQPALPPVGTWAVRERG